MAKTKDGEDIRKKIEVYIYEDQHFGNIVQDHLILDYNGGDCIKAIVSLPKGFDTYETVMGETVIVPEFGKYEGIPLSFRECLYYKNGILRIVLPDMKPYTLKLENEERVSRAFTI